jgi:ATP-dependent DNA helicase RecG
MFDNRLEVKSPGGLPKPFDLSEITREEGVHFARNPMMVRLFQDLDYMRDMGTGLPKMVRTMEENGQRPPEFRAHGELFQVTLLRSSIYDDATREWIGKFSKFDLNWRQIRALAYARNHGMSFASSDYQRLGKVDRDTAYREIREMTDLGVVEHRGGPHTRRYEVKEPDQ